MLKDDGVIADERGVFTKATSTGPEIGPARTLSSHMRARGLRLRGCPCLSRPVAAPASMWAGRGEDDHRAETVASPLRVPTPLLSKQFGTGASLLDQEEWEVKKMIDRRRMEKSYQYRVR